MAVFDVKGRYITEIKGDWTVVHDIVLFEEEVADLHKYKDNMFTKKIILLLHSNF